jgi:hypothetical protein
MLDGGLEESRTLTRRRLIQGGGAAFAVAMIDLHAWAPALASTVSGSAPAYLRRSSYEGLTGSAFEASFAGGGQALTLASISDLGRPEVAGADDAFSLEFTGSSEQVITQGIHTLSHPSLGSFDVFVAAVDQPEQTQAYQLIVDRSIKLSGEQAPSEPEPQATAPSSGSGGAPPQSPSPTSTKTSSAEPDGHPPAHHTGHVRDIHVHRAPHGVLVEAEISAAADVKVLRAWLRDGQRLLGVAEHHVHGQRVSLQIHTKHRAPAGRYELVLATVDTHDVETMAPHPITLH